MLKMAFNMRPLAKSFDIEISGLDLSSPIDDRIKDMPLRLIGALFGIALWRLKMAVKPYLLIYV